MRRFFSVALFGLSCGAACVAAQAPAATGPGKPAESGSQKPVAASPSSANPFPGDTSNVPVLPSSNAPVLPAANPYGTEGGGIPLLGDDQDPVRSPDEPAPAADNGPQSQWSSSLTGLSKLLPQPGSDQTGNDENGKKKRRFGRETTQTAPAPQESSSQDLSVGSYYLQSRNWKAALSRFESAMILDPDNPEVYWGLAESERGLGDFFDARGYYVKVIEYDPGSRHAKDARKALRDPEIANARKAASAPVVAAQP